MDKLYYKEMAENLDRLIHERAMEGKHIYLFGHCDATEELMRLLWDRGFQPEAILDNNTAKHGKVYLGIEVRPPQAILKEQPSQVLVCTVARAWASMASQLKRLGYEGQFIRLVDYNSYAEYSLSQDTVARKKQRADRGINLLRKLGQKYPDCFKILCPFSALGDIYFMMSYLPYFLRLREIRQCVIGVIGNSCAEVVGIFGAYNVEVFNQKCMDELIQAALYTEDTETFIPHQDRPYVVNLSKALHVKKIPLEYLYRCGVFGLPADAKPYQPVRLREYTEIEQIEPERSVILSPYAKSVTALGQDIWEQIVKYYIQKGYSCYTNVVGGEAPLPKTRPISPSIAEVRSAAERAGTFIGIRSGLCDVLKEASCRKIALYPDYYYGDTRWKAIEMYGIEGWENIETGEGHAV